MDLRSDVYIKIAAAKPEIHVSTFVHGISKLLKKIATKFSTAIPMFLGLGNKERLVGILSDVWVCRK